MLKQFTVLTSINGNTTRADLALISLIVGVYRNGTEIADITLHHPIHKIIFCTSVALIRYPQLLIMHFQAVLNIALELRSVEIPLQ